MSPAAAMTSVRARFSHPVGVRAIGTRLGVPLGQLTLNEPSDGLLIVGGLDIGLLHEIWTHRPWGRCFRHLYGGSRCGIGPPGCFGGGLGSAGWFGLAGGLGPAGFRSRCLGGGDASSSDGRWC